MKKELADDAQISDLAGELFVAAELLKRRLQTSITFGNAKANYLFATHPTTNRKFTIQVKTLRHRNRDYFPIDHRRCSTKNIYVFVVLNKVGEAAEYYIVPGRSLAESPQLFGSAFRAERVPGIHPKHLTAFKDNWAEFEKPI